MHVVAWHKNELETLIFFIVLYAPYLHIVPQFVKIDAVEVATRICLVGMEKWDRVCAWRGKIFEVQRCALVIVDKALFLYTFNLPHETHYGFNEFRIVFELFVEVAFDAEREA